jgi:hypothetical protein
VHVPDAHDSDAFARLQAAPQAPQFVRVTRFVSQPFAELPSQFPKPVLHVPSWHAEPLHIAPALAKVQTVPQPLQLATLLVRFVSQPSETWPLQLPNPVEHVIEQVPAEHEGVPFVVEQGAPQAPQLVLLVCVLVSQPFAALPSQLPNPALHDTSWHVPVAQEALPLVIAQAVPQAPQLGVVWRFVSHPLFGLPSQSA